MDARLIRSAPASGAENMAVDECLLESAASGCTTLRFYSWLKPTLSLGYFQAFEERLRAPLQKAEDLAVVRRASGGGAILHHHELTYSFATSHSNGFQSEQLYLDFHETLIDSLRQLGLPAKLYSETRSTRPCKEEEALEKRFLCFERRSDFDLIVGPHKIAGSAQRKVKNGLLQHGSILLEASPHAPQLLGLADLATPHLDTNAIVDRWLTPLSKRLDLTMEERELTQIERKQADLIADQKFSAKRWLKKR